MIQLQQVRALPKVPWLVNGPPRMQTQAYGRPTLGLSHRPLYVSWASRAGRAQAGWGLQAAEGCPPPPCPHRPHTHVHVIAEGRVGPILEATLVAHVIEDARWYRREVDDILGGRVIQAEAPPTAAEMRQEYEVRSHLSSGAEGAA